MYFYEDYHYGDADWYSAFQLRDISYPYHFHRCFELLSVISGKLSVTVDDQNYLLREGELILIFPNQLHSFETLDNSLLNIIIFSPELIDDFSVKYAGCAPENPVIRTYYITLDKILTTNIFARKSLLYHICGLYIDQCSMAKRTLSEKTSLLHTILTFVGEHFHEKCTLQELSANIGYEYTYLSKYFKSSMKISYTAYLNQLRIREACKLLQKQTLSISEIAFQCGYDTVRTFNRNFIRITGKTPSAYYIAETET